MNQPNDPAPINCMIYRCGRKAGMFLYLRADIPLDELPVPLTKATGHLEFSFELSLKTDTKLAQENIVKVRDNLQGQGYHLQMPPPDVAIATQDERLPSALDVG